MRLHSRPGKTKLLLLVGCGLIALAAGIGGGMFMGKRAQARSQPGKHATQKAKKKGKTIQTVYSLGEQVVNLADTAELRYAKMIVTLGIEQKVAEEKLKEHEPMLRDAVIGVVTKKRFTELHAKGGLKKLKRDVLAALEGRLPEITISEIYFEQFAMQ